MKRAILFIGFAIALLSIFFGFANTAHAESIVEFQSNTVISSDSVATITETIDYDFGASSHHGIKRFLELSSKVSDQDNKDKYYNLNYKLLAVSQDGSPVEVDESLSGFTQQIKIGDASSTITGLHRYVIVYQLSPVVLEDPSGDYINQNITGNGWQVPIARATAQITLPAGVVPTQLRCYTGTQGSTAQDCTITNSANTVTVSTNSVLLSKEGLTVNILTPKASFTQYLTTTSEPIGGSGSMYTSVGVIILAILIGLAGLWIGIIIRLIKAYQQRKARRNETVIAQYEPPDGLLPAEMGILVDNKTNMVEITATLIDLAVRGYLKVQKSGKDYSFVILNSDTGKLQDFEKLLFDMLLANMNSDNVVELSKINGKSAAGVVDDVKDTVVNRLVAKGFYIKGKTKTLKGGASIGGTIAICVFVVIFFRAFAIIALPILGIYLGYLIARTSKMTKAGYDMWAQVAGFKLFLSVTETDRLKFSDAPKRNPELFNKLLPSAIALGVEKEWAKQFKDIDVTKATDWFVSDTMFNAIILSSIINSDFSSSLDSNFAAPSSSSGDFGGGGFSGGGSFGGGGGSSW